MIDYFAQHLWQLWLLISVACLILELTNGDFYVMCFAIGALCASLLSAMGLGFYATLAVFAIVSVASIFFVRPVVIRHLHTHEDSRPSNADALLGRIARVSEPIEEQGFGRVAIDGDDWKAQSLSGQAIPKGAHVKVVGRESIILVVEEEEKAAPSHLPL